jgi:hypothetical protein
MTYMLQAIVGTRETMDAGSPEGLVTIDLTGALKLAPLTSEVRKRYDIPVFPLTDEGLETLPQSVESLCLQLSRHGLVAYLEAEFWGGSGMQAHALFKDGVSLGPAVIGEHAINQALRSFGVSPGSHHDEFAAVGLGRYRNTDDWARRRNS